MVYSILLKLYIYNILNSKQVVWVVPHFRRGCVLANTLYQALILLMSRFTMNNLGVRSIFIYDSENNAILEFAPIIFLFHRHLVEFSRDKGSDIGAILSWTSTDEDNSYCNILQLIKLFSSRLDVVRSFMYSDICLIRILYVYWTI